eukprot:9490487-Pyramimonas_sp.AAC.4
MTHMRLSWVLGFAISGAIGWGVSLLFGYPCRFAVSRQTLPGFACTLLSRNWQTACDKVDRVEHK